MTSEIIDSGVKREELEKTGTEFNSHMTNDGAPGSHSALFGLASEDGKESKNSGSTQPGDVLANEHKVTKESGSEPTPAQPEAKTATMADGSSTSVPPGAGSTTVSPEQGTGKV